MPTQAKKKQDTTDNPVYDVEGAYDQFKPMIHGIVYKMVRNVPQNRRRYYEEEMLSLCFSLLIPVCRGYNPQIAKFSTYLTTSLFRHLYQWKKREQRREHLRNDFLQSCTQEDIETPADRNQNLKVHLSEDALYISDLVCDPPRSLLDILPEDSIPAKSRIARRDWREAIREYLLSIHWGRERINRAYDEIQAYFEGNA